MGAVTDCAAAQTHQCGMKTKLAGTSQRGVDQAQGTGSALRVTPSAERDHTRTGPSPVIVIDVLALGQYGRVPARVLCDVRSKGLPSNEPLRRGVHRVLQIDSRSH